MTKTKVMNWLQKNTMVIILVLVVLFFTWQTGGKILLPQNITNLIAQNAYVFILATARRDSRAERGSLLPLEMNACLPGCVWNATPRSLSPLERNIGFWTQA